MIRKENLARRGLINAIIVTAVAGTDKRGQTTRAASVDFITADSVPRDLWAGSYLPGNRGSVLYFNHFMSYVWV